LLTAKKAIYQLTEPGKCCSVIYRSLTARDPYTYLHQLKNRIRIFWLTDQLNATCWFSLFNFKGIQYNFARIKIFQKCHV